MRRVAAALRAMGVRGGTRVLIGGRNSVDLIVIHTALRHLGAVLVPLVPGLSQAELSHQVRHSKAEYLVADDAVLQALDPAETAAEGCLRTVVDFPRELASWLAQPPLEDSLLDAHTDRDPWAIFYTSGSSGLPKGVVLPAGSFPSVGRGYVERFGITAHDNYFLPLTVGHAVGGITAQAVAITAGCRLTIEERFSPRRFWTSVAENSATCSILFPAQLNLLMEVADEAPTATPLRLVITHAPHAAFARRFGVTLGVCWGMTETGATSTGSRIPDPLTDTEGYVGIPMDGVEVGIFDETGKRLAPGQVGEIWLRHEYVMFEYLDDPAATAATLQDGWVRSGDRGRLTLDDELFYLGRIKNMIKRSGENISPEEVEISLHNVPGVQECVVFGVPDRIRTEEVAALVVSDDDGLDEQKLMSAIAEELAVWKLPRYVLLRATRLPRLPNGKINRRLAIQSVSIEQFWDRRAHA